mgnify:CR=1 FL=1
MSNNNLDLPYFDKLLQQFYQGNSEILNQGILKNKFKASHGHLKGAEYKRARKAYFAEQGYLADGRAAANEFGTAKMAAQPFLRTSLESQAQAVSATLGQILKQKIEQYRSRNV